MPPVPCFKIKDVDISITYKVPVAVNGLTLLHVVRKNQVLRMVSRFASTVLFRDRGRGRGAQWLKKG